MLVKAGIAEWAFDGFDKSELDEISKLGTLQISKELYKRAIFLKPFAFKIQ